MVEREEAFSDRLTRDYPQTQEGRPLIDPDWDSFREELFEELNPRSLKDRILAEGIENIAQRAFYLGRNFGMKDGVETAYDYTLHLIAALKVESNGHGVSALTTLEAQLLRNNDLNYK